ncbi:hypothetical protein B0H21DRAFT_167358 [Amylocystis lapponica]|nr:hypothetical protein B0H21DRAFT_167358 [Amylocystis lapponica]
MSQLLFTVCVYTLACPINCALWIQTPPSINCYISTSATVKQNVQCRAIDAPGPEQTLSNALKQRSRHGRPVAAPCLCVFHRRCVACAMRDVQMAHEPVLRHLAACPRLKREQTPSLIPSSFSFVRAH